MQNARGACHIGGMKWSENGMVEIFIPRSVWEDVTSQELFNLNVKGVTAPKGMKIVAIKKCKI